MTDYQNSELKMFLEVENFFKTNSDLTTANAVLKKHVDKLNSLIADLEKNKQKQETNTTGFAKEKKDAKIKFAETIYSYSAAIRSYATDTNNQPVYNKFKISESRIVRLVDVDIVNYAKNEADYIKDNVKDLKPYGITADDLTNLKTQIENYEALLLKPAQQRKEKSVATKNIKKIISQTNKLLSISIDNDMVQYRETQANLYSQYLKLREIDDSATTALSIKGKVTDADTGEPLKYGRVIYKFKAGADYAESVKSTTAQGNYQFKGLPEGKCTVTFEKNYYQTLVIDSEVHHDEFTRLDVQLKKIEKD